MRYLTGAALALSLASVAPALAQSPPPPMMMSAYNWGGWYLGANLGAGWGDNAVNFSGTGGTPPAQAAGVVPGSLAGHPDGMMGGLQTGYNFNLGSILLGIETDFDRTGINDDGTKTTSVPTFLSTTSDAQQQTSYLGTLRGRIGFTPWNPVLLYATGGLAYGHTEVTSSVQTAGCTGFCGRASTAGWQEGWTAGGGFEWGIAPALSMKAEYLYYDLGTVNQNYTDFASRFAGTSVSTSTKFAGNVVRIGVNYHFGAPPPPPPAPAAMPAPPPAAPKVFIVFFDWDKDTITPEGAAIIQQAADAYKSGAPVQLQVTGYTDRSGSPGYNQRLSERRANNVAKAMAALGVPKDQMIVSGRGENDNRVPTADGVREPQNRRVEIVSP